LTNPYEATLANVIFRVHAWVRGLVRHYRRPLMLAIIASVTFAIGINAGHATASSARTATAEAVAGAR
jgi:hypothetical protein